MSTKHKTGFTLVEMMVVVPIVLILIATLVYVLIQMVNGVTVSNEKAHRLNALNQVLATIEQDVSVTNQFLVKPTLRDARGTVRNDFIQNSYSNPQLKQSVMNGIASEYFPADMPPSSFNKSPRLILNRLATSARSGHVYGSEWLSYYSDSYGARYKSPSCNLNPPVMFNTVYFVTGRTLYRRNIFPRIEEGSGNYVYSDKLYCGYNEINPYYRRGKSPLPQHKPTCNASDMIADGKKYCKLEDQKLLDDAELKVEYLDDAHNVINELTDVNAAQVRNESDSLQALLDQVKTIRVTITVKVRLNKSAAASEIQGHILVNKISDVPSY